MFGHRIQEALSMQQRSCQSLSVQGEGQLNIRASFLAGRPVMGDALLSKIRLRPNESGPVAIAQITWHCQW